MRMAALLLLCLMAATPEPAAVDTLAPDAEARWVPFELTPSNQIRFAAMVDDRPVSAILDTGVSYSVLSRDFVDAAKMHPRPGATALTIGGAVSSGWVSTRNIRFGAFARRGGIVATAALPIAATGGTAVDMLIGSDVTGGYALDIDYDAHRFRLLRSGRLPFAGSTAPLRIAGSWPSYVTDIQVGQAHISRIVVDTGDGGAVTLRQSVWNFLGNAGRPSSSTVAYGIGGEMVVVLAIAPAIGSGTITARDVEVRVEPAGGYTAAIGMNGRIGSGFLRGYRVLLDPAAGRMVLQPGKLADAPPLRSTSGLLLRRDGDRLTVLHVMRGGPAQARGWRTGEQICTVDGVAVDNQAPLKWPVGTPGRTVQLGMCDGEIRPLTLRLFY